MGNGLSFSLKKDGNPDRCYNAQINPENIMLTEVSQTSKDKYSMPPLLYSSIPRGVKFKEADSRKVVTVSRTGSGAKRNGDLVFNEHRASAAR